MVCVVCVNVVCVCVCVCVRTARSGSDEMLRSKVSLSNMQKHRIWRFQTSVLGGEKKNENTGLCTFRHLILRYEKRLGFPLDHTRNTHAYTHTHTHTLVLSLLARRCRLRKRYKTKISFWRGKKKKIATCIQAAKAPELNVTFRTARAGSDETLRSKVSLSNIPKQQMWRF